MFKYLFTLLLATTPTLAGLPPTSVQGLYDATPTTKFNFQVPYNQYTTLGGIKAYLDTGNRNLLSNSSFENSASITPWLFTNATPTLETTIIHDGKYSAKISASSQTSTYSQDVTPSVQTLGTNYEASCWVNTTLTNVQVCSRTGGVDAQCVAAPSSGNWSLVTATVAGPANGTSVGVEVSMTGSGTGSFYVDDCYVGPMRNSTQVSQAQFIGSAYIPATASCTWARTNTALGSFSTTSACPGPTVEFNPGPGIIQTTDTDLPKFTVNNLPPGNFLVIMTTMAAGGGTSAYTDLAINDGTTTSGYASGRSAGSSAQFNSTTMVGNFVYTTSGNRTFEIYGAATASSINIENQTNGNQRTQFAIYLLPNTAQLAYRADSTPANWSGYQTVSGGCSTTSSTYADPSACTSIALTELKNRNFGTVTTAGSSLPGITFTPPRLGNYLVCAAAQLSTTLLATDSARLTDGTNIINQGKSVTISAAGDGAVTVCGVEPITAAGAVTVKLQLAASTSTNAIVNGAATGSSAIDWSVVELDAPMPAPYLTGSVISPSTAVETTIRANMVCSSSSSITHQDASGFTSIGNISSGKCSVVIPASTFSSTSYDCNVTENGTSVTTMNYPRINNKTSTGFDLYFANIATGSSTIAAATSVTFDIQCRGPK